MEIFIFDTHRRLSAIIAPYALRHAIPVNAAHFHWKKPVTDMLEANKKQVPPKSYSLKIRIDSVNQILKNKEKVHKPVIWKYTDQNYRSEDSGRFMSIK